MVEKRRNIAFRKFEGRLVENESSGRMSEKQGKERASGIERVEKRVEKQATISRK